MKRKRKYTHTHTHQVMTSQVSEAEYASPVSSVDSYAQGVANLKVTLCMQRRNGESRVQEINSRDQNVYAKQGCTAAKCNARGSVHIRTKLREHIKKSDVYLSVGFDMF